MRRAAPFVLLVFVAGCGGGGGSTTARPATATQPSVVQPVTARVAGGTVELRRESNTRTSVSLTLTSAPKGLKLELDRGSCHAKDGLKLAAALGSVTTRKQSWSVLTPLPQLTASPLAVVFRRNGTITDCSNLSQR